MALRCVPRVFQFAKATTVSRSVTTKAWGASTRTAFQKPTVGGRLFGTASEVSSPKPTVTKYLVGGAAALGVMGLGAFGAYTVNNVSVDFSSHNTMSAGDAMWDKITHRRVADTYWALLEAVVVTAASANLALRSNALVRFSRLSPGWAAAVSIGGMMATLFGTMAVPQENTVLKHLAFASFAGFTGFTMAPLAAFGGAVLIQAAALTGGIVGSLSFIAINSPSDRFLWMAGPLSMGLAAICLTSLGSIFFPAVLGNIGFNLSLYGGTALFSGFVLYDSSRIITHAKTKHNYDPINECIGLYLDAINLFWRMAMILAGGNRRK